MGIFNYCCALRCKNCEILSDKSGQECTSGVIYAVNSKCTKKFPVEYSGYGYSYIPNNDDIKIYDLNHRDFFECWDINPTDKKSLFVCPTCAKKIKITVNNFNDLEPKKKTTKKAERTKMLKYYTKELEDLLKRRDLINKEIRQARYNIKKYKID